MLMKWNGLIQIPTSSNFAWLEKNSRDYYPCVYSLFAKKSINPQEIMSLGLMLSFIIIYVKRKLKIFITENFFNFKNSYRNRNLMQDYTVTQMRLQNHPNILFIQI
jgi:hypothetical protein